MRGHDLTWNVDNQKRPRIAAILSYFWNESAIVLKNDFLWFHLWNFNLLNTGFRSFETMSFWVCRKTRPTIGTYLNKWNGLFSSVPQMFNEKRKLRRKFWKKIRELLRFLWESAHFNAIFFANFVVATKRTFIEPAIHPVYVIKKTLVQFVQFYHTKYRNFFWTSTSKCFQFSVLWSWRFLP